MEEDIEETEGPLYEDPEEENAIAELAAEAAKNRIESRTGASADEKTVVTTKTKEKTLADVLDLGKKEEPRGWRGPGRRPKPRGMG